MSNWILEGKRVGGKYLGEGGQFVMGTVTESRVAYGGTVKHTVQLDKPINMFGAVRERVILDHCHILTVDGE